MITIGKWLNLFVKYFGPIHSSEYLQILSSKRIQNYLTLSQERETTFLSLSQLVEKVSSSLSLSLFLSHFKDGCFFDGFSDKMTNLMQINIDV